MAYYDRLVRDPNAALGEIAERRNLSREELLSRLSAVRDAAQSGSHLTLGQAQSFFDDSQPPPPALTAHVDGCVYCQSMLDGLHPRRVEQVAERLRKEIDARLDSPLAVPPGTLITSSRSKWLQPATAAALGFVLAIAVVAKPVAAYFSDSRELVALKAENARLRGTVATMYVENASLDGFRPSAFIPLRTWGLSANAFAQVSCEMRGSGSDRDGVCVLPPSVEFTPGDKIVVLNLTKNAQRDVPELDFHAIASDLSAAADAPHD
jgi:hypothetical protein